MTTVNVNPGGCGLNTKLIITTENNQLVKIYIQSECQQIKDMGSELELTELDGYQECFAKYSTSTIYKIAEKCCRHLACPVPTAIIKGMEVACGLNVAKDATIRIEKE
ncbi:MAG: hypothetical protein AB9836_07135 [Aminipila sp.]